MWGMKRAKEWGTWSESQSPHLFLDDYFVIYGVHFQGRPIFRSSGASGTNQGIPFTAKERENEEEINVKNPSVNFRIQRR